MSHRVLVFEDDSALGLLYSEWIRNMGCESRVATSPNEAEDFCRVGLYDLVVVDMFVQRADGRLAAEGGLSLISHLREPSLVDLPSWVSEVPIVAITGARPIQGFDVLDSARVLGATVTLRKPFDEATFVDVCRSLLGSGERLPPA